MSDSDRIMVVGLGSPHGDDQAGWIAINRLESMSLRAVECVRLAVPHDLLDRLDGIQALHLIDACDGNDSGLATEYLRFEAKQIGKEARLYWHSLNGNREDGGEVNLMQPTGLRSAGSHQLDVLTVLDLANCLKRLPDRVVLWTIPGFVFGPVSEVSIECDLKVEHCVAAIGSELRLTRLSYGN